MNPKVKCIREFLLIKSQCCDSFNDRELYEEFRVSKFVRCSVKNNISYNSFIVNVRAFCKIRHWEIKEIKSVSSSFVGARRENLISFKSNDAYLSTAIELSVNKI